MPLPFFAVAPVLAVSLRAPDALVSKIACASVLTQAWLFCPRLAGYRTAPILLPHNGQLPLVARAILKAMCVNVQVQTACRKERGALRARRLARIPIKSATFPSRFGTFSVCTEICGQGRRGWRKLLPSSEVIKAVAGR